MVVRHAFYCKKPSFALIHAMSKASKNLQLSLKKYFASNSILRGAEYYKSNSVNKLFFGDNGAMASVRGTEVYKVSLQWSEKKQRTVSLHCTCPHFEDLNFCKHLWAFILKLDELGFPNKKIALSILHVEFGETFKLKSARSQDTIKTNLLASSPEILIKEEDINNTYLKIDNTSLKDENSNQSEPQTQPEPPQLMNWRNTDINKFKTKFIRPGLKKKYEIFVHLKQNMYDEETMFFHVYKAEMNLDGSFKTPKLLSIPDDGYIDYPDTKLQSLVKKLTLLSIDHFINSRSSYSYGDSSSNFELDSGNVRRILPDLLKTGKVYVNPNKFLLSTKDKDLSLKPGVFQKLCLKATEHEGGLKLSAQVEVITTTKEGTDNSNIVNIGSLDLIQRPDLFLFQDQYMGYLDLTEEEHEWFNELYNSDLFIPPEDKEAFLEIIYQSNTNFEMPGSLNLVPKKVIPIPQVNILRDKAYNYPRYLLDLKFQYGSRVVSYSNYSPNLPCVEDGFLYSRDQNEEKQVHQRLPLDLTFTSNYTELSCLLASNLKEFVTKTLAAGLSVTVEDKKLEVSNDFKFSVASGVDWFDVDAQAGFSGRWVKFPSILEAIQKGENFVALPDGSLGFLTEEVTHRLGKLTAFADQNKGQIRFTSAQGLLLNSLLEKEKNVDLDEKFKKLKAKIKSFSGIKPEKPGLGFKGSLRSYQKEGLGWLKFLDGFGLGGVLADDMGLGKTIQCLAFLQDRKDKSTEPSLLIAPKSVIENWKLEAEKFTPNLKVHIHAGAKREGSKKLFKMFDVITMTYQTMLRDIELLKDITWDCIILDEAQAIKNSGALISKASKLLSANFRLAMTGTPIENSIQDLFSLSDFVNPGFLNGKKSSAHLKLSDDSKESLIKAIKPIILRRTKDQVLKDLPTKTEQIISVELEPKQLKIYNELKRYYQTQLLAEVETKGIKKSQIQILAALTRLRQVALHPGLVDSSKSNFKSAKFIIVLEMLEELIAEGHRVLIFSQFTSLLSLLKNELDVRNIRYSYLDGKTTFRQKVVNEFKSSECPVFLMSLKAGGVGLNLVEADYVFLLDPWWNPAVEAQAIDRVHRIGQTRPVNAYRFIAKNTVEEKILELQKSKRNLSNELFNQKSDSIKSLTVEDIENLFS